MQHRPRKRFGQNFLRDAQVIEKIVRSVNPAGQQSIVEIGPGQGAITRGLVASGARVSAIEIDRDLAARLQQAFAHADNFQLHEADALRFDFSSLRPVAGRLRIVGNMPYNISTPLIFHLLQAGDLIDDMHFMLQKEVVERLAAQPGNGDYGRLSVMVQYHCQVMPLFEVPPGAFFPAPKVDSAVVRLVLRRHIATPARNTRVLGQVVNAAFGQRRKTLRNALRGLIDEGALTSLGIDSKMRAENLSLEDFVTISNALPGGAPHGQ